MKPGRGDIGRNGQAGGGVAGGIPSQQERFVQRSSQSADDSAASTSTFQIAHGAHGSEPRSVRVPSCGRLADRVNYCVADLANLCGISERALERLFFSHTGMPPHQWLNEQRQREGLSMRLAGKSVKEASIDLKYSLPANFSRDFKRFWGRPPSSFLADPVWDRPPREGALAKPGHTIEPAEPTFLCAFCERSPGTGPRCRAPGTPTHSP